MADERDEIVSVPVPFRYLADVYRALAEAMQRDNAPPKPPPASTVPVVAASDGIDWTDVGNCRILRAGINSLGLILMLDMVAQEKGAWVSLSDIAARYQAELGKTIENVRADTRVLTRIIKREFGDDKDYGDWPMKADWGRENDSQRYYRMEPEVADAWIASA